MERVQKELEELEGGEENLSYDTLHNNLVAIVE